MNDNGRGKRRWTPRLILRWIGALTLVISLLMALYGAYGFDTSTSAGALFFYWTVFFVCMMSTIIIAILDALMTIIGFRKAHTDLRRSFSKNTRANSNSSS